MAFSYIGQYFTIYEFYPESETPTLTQVAHLDLNRSKISGVCLLPGTVIWNIIYSDGIVFRVWDYRLNHSISFSVDVENLHFELKVYFIFIPKHWKWPLTHSLVGNGHENRCHRLMWRSSIDLGRSTSITSTARFSQSHPYATSGTTLHNSISRHFSLSCTYKMEIDQFLVF